MAFIGASIENSGASCYSARVEPNGAQHLLCVSADDLRTAGSDPVSRSRGKPPLPPRPAGAFDRTLSVSGAVVPVRISRRGALVYLRTSQPVSVGAGQSLTLDGTQLLLLATLDGLDPSGRATIRRRVAAVLPQLAETYPGMPERTRELASGIRPVSSRDQVVLNPVQRTLLARIAAAAPGTEHEAQHVKDGTVGQLSGLLDAGLVVRLGKGHLVAGAALASHLARVSEIVAAQPRTQQLEQISTELGCSKGFARELIGELLLRRASDRLAGSWDTEDDEIR